MRVRECSRPGSDPASADTELSGNALAVAAEQWRLRVVCQTDQWNSTTQWVEDIKPELRIIRRGSKTILIPVAELERWVEESPARWGY